MDSVLEYLLEAEHEVERYLLSDNKIDFVECLPWVICSAILWSVLSFAANGDIYFISTVHAVFLSAAAVINLCLGHNDYEYLAFYVMTGYFIADFFLRSLLKPCYINYYITY